MSMNIFLKIAYALGELQSEVRSPHPKKVVLARNSDQISIFPLVS